MTTPAEPLPQSASSLRFDAEIIQIAHILHLHKGNTRQLLVRARKHVTDGRRTPPSFVEQRIVPNAREEGYTYDQTLGSGALL